MAELTIRPEEIRDALERFVQSYEPDAAAREEVGTVTETGDGIAKVEGLPSAMTNELLKFENGTLGIALNLDVRETQERAIRLYDQLGYQRYGIHPHYALVNGRWVTGFYYFKDLTSAGSQLG